jgi:hypothetical protein
MGDTVASVQVDRDFLVVENGKGVEDYSSYYWRSDTSRCDLVREKWDTPWKVNYCEYVISDW